MALGPVTLPGLRPNETLLVTGHRKHDRDPTSEHLKCASLETRCWATGHGGDTAALCSVQTGPANGRPPLTGAGGSAHGLLGVTCVSPESFVHKVHSKAVRIF